MRLRRDKTTYAVDRPSWRSSFLGDPGAKFLCGKLERGTKKEKSSKKERKEGLWKLTLLMEIRKERGFPQQLEKSLAKDARLFHSSHRPNNNLSIMFCRQQSTLRRLTFGPKDGEHLILLRNFAKTSRVERLDQAGGTVVGLLKDCAYEQSEASLAPGDLLVIYTDGFSEAMNPDLTEWGEERLIESIVGCVGLHAQGVIARIMQAADAFAAGAPRATT
jgi:Stage II sporulation protein E (SpoIIE)